MGTNQHSQNFNNLKDYPRAKYIKNLKNKFNRGDDLADAADFFDIDLNSDSKSNLNKGFYSLVIIDWIGRIYKEIAARVFQHPSHSQHSPLMGPIFPHGILRVSECARAVRVCVCVYTTY